MCLPQLDIRKIQQRNSLSSLTETLDERDANYHFHGGKVDGWHSAFEHLPHEVSFRTIVELLLLDLIVRASS